jgi:hypothetical protein
LVVVRLSPRRCRKFVGKFAKPSDGGSISTTALIQSTFRSFGAETEQRTWRGADRAFGYEKGDPAGRGNGNSRNGASSNSVARDRAGSFEPQLIAKGQTRFDGFDDKVLSLCARGMTVREIQGHLAELYGSEVSPDLISRVTDAVLDEVREWQNRPLDLVYPVVFFDALRVKIRDEGLVRNKAVYVALALNPDGEKDVLGLWIEQSEGAKFWLKAVNEFKVRGVNDILIAVVDGLKCFSAGPWACRIAAAPGPIQIAEPAVAVAIGVRGPVFLPQQQQCCIYGRSPVRPAAGWLVSVRTSEA